MLDSLYQSLDPIAFSIGPVAVRWYGLAWIAGFLLAALFIPSLCRRWQIRISFDSLLTIVVACMLGAIIGGRLGYVIFYGQGYYFAHPLEIFATRDGGMSFHGGLLGLAAGLIIAARIIKVPLLTLGDIAAITATFGLGLVRIANFINGELWGAETTLPWGVVFADTGGGLLPRHPTQLYEAVLEGLVLFLILYLLARRRPPLPQGSHFGVFLIGYGIFRIAIEFVRQPDVQLGYLLGSDWVTMGMLLSLPMIVAGALFLLYAQKTRRPQAGQAVLAEGAEAALAAGDEMSVCEESAEPLGAGTPAELGAGTPAEPATDVPAEPAAESATDVPAEPAAETPTDEAATDGKESVE